MRNLVVMMAIWLIGDSGIDHQKATVIKEADKLKTDSLENVISAYEKSSVTEPCKEIPCDSNSYFNKGIAEGLKRCPIHKDKPCNCDPCPTHKLEVLEVGTVNKNTLWKVVSKCGTDCTEVVKIGVKKLDQK